MAYFRCGGVKKKATQTYTATQRGAALDMGEDNEYRYVNTNGVPNSNSDTYVANSRGAALDMGATNTNRYVNTNNVPNTNSGTYTYPVNSTGGTYDMGAANTNRYVNASNVYSKGVADGKASSPFKNVIAGDVSGVTISQYYGSTKNSDNTITVNASTFNGIMVKNTTGNTVNLLFMFSDIGSANVQYGVASATATLPSVIQSASGRESPWQNADLYNNVAYTISIPNNKQFFIGNNNGVSQAYKFKLLGTIA